MNLNEGGYIFIVCIYAEQENICFNKIISPVVTQITPSTISLSVLFPAIISNSCWIPKGID